MHAFSRNRRPARLLPPLAALFLAASAPAAKEETRALYLYPSEDAPVIARVPAGDPALAAAVAVIETNGRAASPWLWTNYRATLEGYVPGGAVGKNYEIEPDTSVRQQPDPEARALARIEATDTVEVLGGDAEWARVRLTKVLPLYLRREVPASAPPPRIALERTEAPPAAPAPAPAVRRDGPFDPDLGVGALDTAALPSENTRWKPAGSAAASPATPATPVRPAAETPTGPLVVDSPTLAPRQPPRSPEAAPGAPTRSFHGTLERSLPRPFGGSRHPLRLKSPGSGNLAFIDASRLFIRDFRPYIGREVVITGEVRPLVPGEPDLVILARTLRLAEQ